MNSWYNTCTYIILVAGTNDVHVQNAAHTLSLAMYRYNGVVMILT